MKSVISLIFTILSLSTLTLFAQNNVEYYGGLIGGVNASKMIFVPSVSQKIHWGYDGGIVLRADVVSFAGLWLELDYSSRGWTEDNEEHPDLKYSRKINYINIPFLTHFRIGKGPIKFTISLGPQFGYLLSETSTSTYKKDVDRTTMVTKQHDMPVEKKFAWGLGGGPGIELHLSKQVIGLRLNYHYGLGEIYGNKRKDYFGKSSEEVYSTKIYYLIKF